uniref:Uncharacterized protein n=1 Tax=Candidatus Kentrum sp. TUN TaxID=2126343 RepID=A0A450ZJH8_9GAMM|nr:MAG: hypothetical protein BECKTUN1418F_GA0071002_103110 [Candidatus Kentron sp. TUN]
MTNKPEFSFPSLADLRVILQTALPLGIGYIISNLEDLEQEDQKFIGLSFFAAREIFRLGKNSKRIRSLPLVEMTGEWLNENHWFRPGRIRDDADWRDRHFNVLFHKLASPQANPPLKLIRKAEREINKSRKPDADKTLLLRSNALWEKDRRKWQSRRIRRRV